MFIRPEFVNDHVYHIYNRGVAKQVIFHDNQDFNHFLSTLSFYIEKKPKTKFSMIPPKERARILTEKPKTPLVEILTYCLMPNHFHLAIKQLADGGITSFLKHSLNSYSRAYNTRYNRIGTIFQGRSSAVLVENDEQLLHLSRYQHLNPFVAKIVSKPSDYVWSSYKVNYLDNKSCRVCHPDFILSLAGSPTRYQDFVEDYASYAQDLAYIKKVLIDT